MTRVLRVYHAGRDAGHRRRERALVAAGVDLTLVVPVEWPHAGSQRILSAEPFPVIELPVWRPGDVNRHEYADPASLRSLVETIRPDVVDIHEEPFSLVARQWLRAARGLPVTMYTAQNLDKRFPPPFAHYERHALQTVSAIYPCSRQAASVIRGKGFRGTVRVLPLGYDDSIYRAGHQSPDDNVLVMGIVGRLVREKGIVDAVHVLAAVIARRPAVLQVIGEGPEAPAAQDLARRLGVGDSLRFSPWLPVEKVAEFYRSMHVLLIPSRATRTWVEQFGRVIPEAQASGAVVAGYASGAIGEVAGASGVLVPEGDIERLCTIVTELSEQPDAWNRWRREGLGFAQRCAWPDIARRQAALYREAAERGVAPIASLRPTAARTPAAARELARAEFGDVAEVPGSARPMALPVLRDLPRLEAGVGRVIDLVAQGRARLRIGAR
jgi:glycosyltransferase involved in cell wall biosynthesis